MCLFPTAGLFKEICFMDEFLLSVMYEYVFSSEVTKIFHERYLKDL